MRPADGLGFDLWCPRCKPFWRVLLVVLLAVLLLVLLLFFLRLLFVHLLGVVEQDGPGLPIDVLELSVAGGPDEGPQ